MLQLLREQRATINPQMRKPPTTTTEQKVAIGIV
jgi:hypothetical protein